MGLRDSYLIPKHHEYLDGCAKGKILAMKRCQTDMIFPVLYLSVNAIFSKYKYWHIAL